MSIGGGGVNLTLTTNKESDAPGDTVTVNLLLENHSGVELSNVTMENLTPAGCVPESGASSTKTLDRLADNGSVTHITSFQVEKDIVPPQTGDDTPISLWVSLALISGCLLFALKKFGKKRTVTLLLIFALTTSLLPVDFARAEATQKNPQMLTAKKNVTIKGVPTEVRSQVTYSTKEMEPDNEPDNEDALFFKEPDAGHIQHDEARDIYYVDNQILLVAKEGTPQAQVEALIKSCGGEIVGMIALTDDYQAEFKQAMTRTQLEELCNTLLANSIIESANLHIYFETVLNSNEFIPNDREWNSEWNADGKADGKNWGVEAIQAPVSWQYRNVMSTVNVGIIDTMFDANHEDLSFARIFNNPVTIKNGHGTHVSGIIGAKFNNAKGIAGVAPKVNLYGYSVDNKDMSSVMEYKYGLIKLVTSNCRVINISMGADISKWTNTDNDFNKSLDAFITKLVNYGYDFLIVKSAGNNGSDLTNNDYFSGCTQNRSRILVVGAMNQNGELASFSNRGSRIDLVAPGTNIYSTWPQNKYQSQNGTSMAAAFASGIAAMCYSINPSLTASQVKTILCNNAGATASGNYGIINAKLAVEKTLTDAGMPVNTEESDQTVTLGGSVTTADGSSLSGVKVTVSRDANATDVVNTVYTNANGAWLLAGLPAGVDYYATFELDGYTFNNPVKNPKVGNSPVVASPIQPEEVEWNASPLEDFWIEVIDTNNGYKNTCRIKKYIGKDENVVVPKYDSEGRKISTIGWDAFKNNNKVTHIAIPDTVEIIESSAFENCKELMSVNLGNGVKYIYSYAFSDCSSLQSIVIPDSVREIGELIFGKCKNLTRIDIGNGVGSIPEQAFFYCNSLTDVNIGNNVHTIGVYAFQSCTSLKSIRLPESVKTIERGAFYDCSNLTSIYIPKSVVYFEDDMGQFHANIFEGCNNLTIYGVAGSKAEEYANSHNIPFVADQMPEQEEVLTGEFTDGTNKITSMAMTVDESKQVSGTVKSTVSNIQHVTLTINGYENPNNENGYYATYDYAGNSGKTIELQSNSVFTLDASKAPLNVPGTYTVKLWGSTEKTDGKELTTLQVTVKEVGNKVESNPISDFEFLALTDTTCAVTAYIGDETEIVIPSVDANGRTVVAVSEPRSIYSSPCFSSRPLRSITIPDSVLYITHNAFSFCTSLTSINIPNSVIRIDGLAFSRCSSLTSINIPSSVVDINGDPFDRCYKLSSINVAPDNKKYCSVNGVLFDKEKTKLIRYPSGLKGSYVIPSSVNVIGYHSFMDCTGLTGITIPNSVTVIGADAFCGCTGLKNLTIPNSVSTIGGSAFLECSHLQSITIPDSVKRIENGTFRMCSDLESIVIPGSVTTIGERAFEGCTSLTNIIIPDSVTSMDEYMFFDCTNLSSVTLSNCLTEITESFFLNCTNLRSITIPNSVNSIGLQAFGNCQSLTSITIPNSVNFINYQAFANCKNLTSIIIPDSVSKIGADVFSGCEKLTIYGVAGSKAEEYANEYNINFKLIGSGNDSENVHFSVTHSSLNENTLTLNPDAVAKEFCTLKVESNAAWTAMLDGDSFVKFVKIEGDNNSATINSNTSAKGGTDGTKKTVNLRIEIVSPPALGQTANAKLTFNVNGESKEYTITEKFLGNTFTVKQKNATDFIIPQGSISGSFACDSSFGSGDKVTFVVNCSYDWTVKASDQSWMTVAKNGNEAIVTIGSVQDGKNYSGKLTFTTIYNKTYTINITLNKPGVVLEPAVALTVKNQASGATINNTSIIEWPVNQSFTAALSATNGNNKYHVTAYTMSKKPTGDKAADKQSIVNTYGTNGYWYIDSAAYTDTTVPLQANAGAIGQYVKFEIAAEDVNYSQNQGLDEKWFALELVEAPVSVTGKVSDELLEFLRKRENCILYLYDDKDSNDPKRRWDESDKIGTPTIGMGHVIRKDSSDFEYYRTHDITIEQAKEFKRQDLQTVIGYVDDFVANNGLSLNQHQYDAIASYFFNCGTPSYFVNFFKGKDINNIPIWQIYNIFAWPVTSKGTWMGGLYTRRMDEATMFVYGTYYSANYGESSWSLPSWWNSGSGSRDTIIPKDWYPVELKGKIPDPEETTTVIAISSISLNPSTAQTIGIGDNFTNQKYLPTVNYEPSTATNKTVTWASSDKAVATVDSSTGIVTGKKAGSATITATATNTDGTTKTASYKVYVVDAPVIMASNQTPTSDDRIIKWNIANNLNISWSGQGADRYLYKIVPMTEKPADNTTQANNITPISDEENATVPSASTSYPAISSSDLANLYAQGKKYLKIWVRSMNSNDLSHNGPAYWIGVELQNGEPANVTELSVKINDKVYGNEENNNTGLSFKAGGEYGLWTETSFSSGISELVVGVYDTNNRPLSGLKQQVGNQKVSIEGGEYTPALGETDTFFASNFFFPDTIQEGTYWLIAKATWKNGDKKEVKVQIQISGKIVISLMNPVLNPQEIYNNFPCYNEMQSAADLESVAKKLPDVEYMYNTDGKFCLWKNHRGNDSSVYRGSAVIAVRGGRVESVSWDNGGGGNIVTIVDEQYPSIRYQYMHLLQGIVEPGTDVKAGELIAFSSNTGGNYGNHLHLAIPIYGFGSDVYLNPVLNRTGKKFQGDAYQFNTSPTLGGRWYKNESEMRDSLTLVETGYKVVYNTEQRSSESLKLSCMVPVNLNKSTGWRVRGLVSSNYKITEITVTIEGLNGEIILGPYTVKPQKYMYDMLQMDNAVSFSKLNLEGEYYYHIKATDESRKSEEIFEKFTVTNANKTEKLTYRQNGKSEDSEYVKVQTDKSW
ncbi:MAG: leucine-rich repeat protein [Anaerolineaceae bacterium]|nr:leucine-rich repeat protein [Anaerolineaceae bacterium]